MAILNEYKIKILRGKAVLDKDIYLTRGDKNVNLYFSIDNLPFLFKNDSNEDINPSQYQIILQKPNGDLSRLQKQSLIDNKIVFIITKDIVDELIEVGDYSLQIVLYDDSGSNIALPVIENQMHVLDILALEDGSTDKVNNSSINVGHISIGDDIDVFNEDKGYNITNWVNNDTITNTKMNKIENALSYILDNDVIYKTPSNGVLNLSSDKFQSSIISESTQIVLPNINYVFNFTLFLKCEKNCTVTFKSVSDSQEVQFVTGYQTIKCSYIGDWIINC